MYRLATLLALLIALAAVGCGGSGDDSNSAPSAVAGASESTPSGDASDDSASKDEAKSDDGSKNPSDEENADASGPASDSEHDHAETLSDLSPKERNTAIDGIVRSALLQFGLKVAALDVKNGGRALDVTITRATACRAVASQESNMLVTIQHGAPIVKSARFGVEGSDKELGYYVLGCKKPEMPNGAGRVVLEHDGVGGPYTSKTFEIESKHWALEWENQGASLAVILYPRDEKAKHNYAKPVGSKKPEAGRYDYTGGGKYLVKAYGQGAWSIRVKEIG